MSQDRDFVASIQYEPGLSADAWVVIGIVPISIASFVLGATSMVMKVEAKLWLIPLVIESLVLLIVYFIQQQRSPNEIRVLANRVIVQSGNPFVVAMNRFAHQQPTAQSFLAVISSVSSKRSSYSLCNVKGIALKYRWDNFVLLVAMEENKFHEIELLCSDEKALLFWQELVEKKFAIDEVESIENPSRFVPEYVLSNPSDQHRIIFEKLKTSPRVRAFWQTVIGMAAICSLICCIALLFLESPYILSFLGCDFLGMFVLIGLARLWVDDLEISANERIVFIRQRWAFLSRIREIKVDDLLCTCVSQEVNPESHCIVTRLILLAYSPSSRMRIKRMVFSNFLEAKDVVDLQDAIGKTLGILSVRNICGSFLTENVDPPN